MNQYLFTADLHLTNRGPDAYRWEIFPWLARQAQNRKVDAIFILGDLTDLKDHHSASLVNRVVEELTVLGHNLPVYLTMGNHDYTDPKSPFFRFLSLIPGVQFIVRPTPVQIGKDKLLLLPHTRQPRTGWKGLRFADYRFVLLHQPIIGAVGANGQEMQAGVHPEWFYRNKSPKTVFIAGDIHVPQTIANVTYCGSPYPIKFGDDHKPRVLFWNGTELRSLPRASIKKVIVTLRSAAALADQGLSEGDMVRVMLSLPRSEFVSWEEHRRAVVAKAQELKLELCGVQLVAQPTRVRVGQAPVPGSLVVADPPTVFTRYCKAKGIDPDLAQAGRDLL